MQTRHWCAVLTTGGKRHKDILSEWWKTCHLLQMHSRHFYWLHRYHNDHGGNTISGITINNFEFLFVPIKNSSSQSKELCSYAFCTRACSFHCKIKGTWNSSSEKRLCSYAFFCTCAGLCCKIKGRLVHLCMLLLQDQGFLKLLISKAKDYAAMHSSVHAHMLLPQDQGYLHLFLWDDDCC